MRPWCNNFPIPKGFINNIAIYVQGRINFVLNIIIISQILKILIVAIIEKFFFGLLFFKNFPLNN